MAEVWEQSVQALRRLYDEVVEAFSGVSWAPATWGREVFLALAVVLLVIVLLIALRWRGRKRTGGPQFLLTNGQVVLLTDEDEAAPADGGKRKPAFLTAPEAHDYQLRVTFNNLNTYPVQLLEIALLTGAERVPVVADASAVVPPNGAVDVVADVHDLPGDRGTLQAFVFATQAKPQNLRISVPLEWEPWNMRYRLRATHQRVESFRGVASDVVSRIERAAARRSAVRERFGSATKSAWQKVTETWEGAAERGRTAAAARRERARAAAAERASRRAVFDEPTGPISVPLTPSRRNDPYAGPVSERDADEGRGHDPSRPGARDPRLADARPVSGSGAPGEPGTWSGETSEGARVDERSDARSEERAGGRFEGPPLGRGDQPGAEDDDRRGERQRERQHGGPGDRHGDRQDDREGETQGDTQGDTPRRRLEFPDEF